MAQLYECKHNECSQRAVHINRNGVAQTLLCPTHGCEMDYIGTLSHEWNGHKDSANGYVLTETV